MACSMTAVSCFIEYLLNSRRRGSVRCGKSRIRPRLYTSAGRSLHWPRKLEWTNRKRPGWRPPGIGRSPEKEEANPMVSNITIIFNFIISQWSLTPQAFKDAVLFAALTKCVLAVIWWSTRMLVAKFPANATLSVFQGLLNTRPAKLVVLVLDITLIDVFLFFACVALLDLHRGFSVFSLWTAALFSFLLVYMVMVAHKDIKKY